MPCILMQCDCRVKAYGRQDMSPRQEDPFSPQPEITCPHLVYPPLDEIDVLECSSISFYFPFKLLLEKDMIFYYKVFSLKEDDSVSLQQTPRLKPLTALSEQNHNLKLLYITPLDFLPPFSRSLTWEVPCVKKRKNALFFPLIFTFQPFNEDLNYGIIQQFKKTFLSFPYLAESSNKNSCVS